MAYNIIVNISNMFMPPSIAFEASHREGFALAGQFGKLVEALDGFELTILDLSDDSLSNDSAQLKLKEKFLNGGIIFRPGYLAFELDSKRYLLFFGNRGFDSNGKKKDFEHLSIWEAMRDNYEEAVAIDAGVCFIHKYGIKLIGSAINIGIDRVKYPLEVTRQELASDLGCGFRTPLLDLEKLPSE